MLFLFSNWNVLQQLKHCLLLVLFLMEERDPFCFDDTDVIFLIFSWSYSAILWN